jgi:hypothetical protein
MTLESRDATVLFRVGCNWTGWFLSCVVIAQLLSSAWFRATYHASAVAEIVTNYGYPKSASVVTSTHDPQVRIELPSAARYVGADRWISTTSRIVRCTRPSTQTRRSRFSGCTGYSSKATYANRPLILSSGLATTVSCGGAR